MITTHMCRCSMHINIKLKIKQIVCILQLILFVHKVSFFHPRFISLENVNILWKYVISINSFVQRLILLYILRVVARYLGRSIAMQIIVMCGYYHTVLLWIGRRSRVSKNERVIIWTRLLTRSTANKISWFFINSLKKIKTHTE